MIEGGAEIAVSVFPMTVFIAPFRNIVMCMYTDVTFSGVAKKREEYRPICRQEETRVSHMSKRRSNDRLTHIPMRCTKSEQVRPSLAPKLLGNHRKLLYLL